VLDRLHRRSFRLNDAEVEEIRSVILGETPAARLRRPRETPVDDLKSQALSAAKRWEVLGMSPVAGRSMAHTCATLARVYHELADSLSDRSAGWTTVPIDRDAGPTCLGEA
jgi:hypothetical protein